MKDSECHLLFGRLHFTAML